jgi:hypothetical protein
MRFFIHEYIEEHEMNLLRNNSEEGAAGGAASPEMQGDCGTDKFSRKQASAYLMTRWGLSCAVHTLAIYAARGTGPEYHKAGPRAVYSREALNAWARSKLTGSGRKASDLKPMTEDCKA